MVVAVLLAPTVAAWRVPPPRMGLLDGVKDAFATTSSEKPPVAADRVTPFDRWLGLDKDLEEAEDTTKQVTFIDPNNVENYVSTSLAKPMGIAFTENEGECGGICIDEVLEEGSAASSSTPLLAGDQLVAVDSALVLGASFDDALDAIKGSASATVKLTFFRGPTSFLYGPTTPPAEWFASSLL